MADRTMNGYETVQRPQQMEKQKPYVCGACGERFSLKTSLQFHIDRHVVNIEGRCAMCRTVKHFHNRCSYLQHANEHNASPDDVFANVQVCALPVEVVEREFDQTFCSSAFTQASQLSALYRLEFGDQLRLDSAHIPGLTATATPAVVMYRCTECRKQFLKADDLQAHFAYSLPPNQRQLICQQANCMAVYFSKCSYAAHTRGHLPTKSGLGQSPFTCAECGLSQATSNALSAHLLGHKTSPTVLNAWRCTKCSMFYANFDTLVQHTATAHCPFTFKCQQCGIDTNDLSAMEEHGRRSHPELGPQTDSSTFLAIKCFGCEQNCSSKDQMMLHARSHLNSAKPFQIYRCPVCGRLLENKSGLVCHYERVHRLKVSLDDVKEKLFVSQTPKRSQ